jgi:hypothetical protein
MEQEEEEQEEDSSPFTPFFNSGIFTGIGRGMGVATWYNFVDNLEE